MTKFKPITHLLQHVKIKDIRLYESLSKISGFLSSTSFKVVIPDGTSDPKVFKLKETPNGDILVFMDGLALDGFNPGDFTFEPTTLKISFRIKPVIGSKIRVYYVS